MEFHQTLGIPPFAPTPPPPSDTTHFVPPPPLAQPPPPRRLYTYSRSRSRSPRGDRTPTPESEHSHSDDSTEEPPFQWRPFPEDRSVPCDDEMKLINGKVEHSAADFAHWEEQTFFELDDPAFVKGASGRIDWLVDRINGTEANPNKETILRSHIVRVGGYDWCIKFYPRGNRTDALSVYLECLHMRNPDFAEFEDFDHTPLPFLEGADTAWIKKRRGVAVQLSIIMFNPDEPRTYVFKKDAHRFSKNCPDFGYRYFVYPEDACQRHHCERQPLLLNDQVAFSAYFQIIKDPTGVLWTDEDDEDQDKYNDSILSTSLRPFRHQSPAMAAYLPLLHYAPFRHLIMAQSDPSKTTYDLQTILYKMLSRTCSDGHPRFAKYARSDAISCLRRLVDILKGQTDAGALESMVGSFSADTNAIFYNRLKSKTCSSLQEAVDKYEGVIATPDLLTLELQRHEWLADQRKWVKLTNKVKVEETLTAGEEQYELYAVITHCRDLLSNRHNVYVRPGCESELWYGYRDGIVTPMTFKQAVTAHEGTETYNPDRGTPSQDNHLRREGKMPEDEVIYVAMYLKASVRQSSCASTVLEDWDVPTGILQGEPWRRFRDNKTPPRAFAAPSADGSATTATRDLLFRPEQDHFEQEQRYLRSITPSFMPKDSEGDIQMRNPDDADDWPLPSPILLSLSTADSRPFRKGPGIQDSLGQDYYQGEEFQGMFQGRGWLVTLAGNSYHGDFYHSRKEGRGTMTYANGDVYEGEWRQDLPHGHGKLVSAVSGSVYVGEWKEGKKHGKFFLQGTVREDDEERKLCTICFEREVNTAFYDCGHVLACKECAAVMENCPVCRRRVLARLQLFGVTVSVT